MKKKSRFLTGLLSAVMALSLCALPVAAEGTTTSTIDTTKKGSLTIEKYEKSAGDSTKGTPLDGVEFTIYKVADISQDGNGEVSLAYNWDNTLFNNTPNLNNTSASALYDSVTAALKNNWKSTATSRVLTTGAAGISGQVKFENLDLGLYLVEETKAPDQIVEKTANFLVSIPMTNETGSGWVYDVVAEPKNVPVYAGVTLKKTARDLVIDNTTPNTAPLENATFKLEKKSGESWVDVTNVTANGTKVDTTVQLNTDSNGQINVQNLAPGTYRFKEISAPNNSGYITDNKKDYEFTVGQDGKITYGDKTDTTIVIDAYNDKPDMTKTVTRRAGDSQQDADYSIGDKVPYTIKVTVPNNIADLKTFKVTDTPTNLAFVNTADDTLKVTCDGTTLTAGTDYVLKENAGGFIVEFKVVNLAQYAGKTLTLNYHAELLASAKTDVTGNPNTAKLIYSNYTDEASAPDDKPKESEIQDSAIVYSFEINIVKKADSVSGNPLANVGFDLYQLIDDSTKAPADATVIDSAKAKELGLKPDAADGKVWAKIKTATTDENGNLAFKGLSNGTYKLVETKTKDGYNLLKEPVDVSLNVQYATTWKNTYNSEGKLIKHEVDTKTFSGDNIVANNEYQVTTIINRKGFDLPVTGGFGTLLFSAIGALLVVGGVGVLMSTKKKKGNA